MKKLICIFVAILSIHFVFAQADFIELGTRQYHALDRFEIMLQKDSVLNFSTMKPFDRKTITERLEFIDSLSKNGHLKLSKVDKYNLNMMLKTNFEWRKNQGDTGLKFKSLYSKEHLTNPLYFGVKKGDFTFITQLNFELKAGKDNNVNQTIYNNSRMFGNWRGTFNKKIGYYTYVTENKLRNPLYVQQFTAKNNAMPGLGYYKLDPTGVVNAFEAKGGIMINAAKGIDLQFAFDKIFIGNGHRSLIVSDFSNNFLFLKVNTRFWRFNYTNIFAQMTNRADVPLSAGDTLFPKKFMALHYLDFQVTKWLNLGFFEQIMFGRPNGSFEAQYLNPMIFYTAMGHNTGSPDKSTIGLTVKANVNKKTQLYSQLIINEFQMKEVLKYSNGWWGNKQALQLGFKHINLFGIDNLDIQGEVNLVRPFVYSSKNNYSSSTHYNQSLAHPLGSNFKEFIGIVKYQPIPKLMLQAKLIYYTQGTDSAGVNMGNNPLNIYTTRPRDYGWKNGTGIKASALFAQLSATYELLPNIFFDADYIIRNYKRDGFADFNSNIISAGFRFNIRKREFDF